jgi:hypothetical protein
MSVPFEIPGGLAPAEPTDTTDIDPHRVEALVNRFIAGKQDALFLAPDAYYRTTGAAAVDGVPEIRGRLEALRDATLAMAGDDRLRRALGPRLDLQLADANDGLSRHARAQRAAFTRAVLAERQALLQRAAELEPTDDDKLAGLAEASAGIARELVRLDGPSEGKAAGQAERSATENARSAIWRAAIGQRLARGDQPGARALLDRVRHELAPADRSALDATLQPRSQG